MAGADGAKYATDALRDVANDLQRFGELIGVGKQMVAEGKVTNAAWGVPAFQPFMKDPATGEWDPPNFEATPELKAFRATYEAAHEHTVARLRDLAAVYGSAADALRNVADYYDGTEQDMADRSYIGVDTQALRWAAFNIYGHTDTWGEDFSINWGALFNRAEEADEALFTHAPTPKILQGIAKHVDDGLTQLVEDDWEGPAYESFERYVIKLRDYTIDEAYRMNRLGKALEELATALDVASDDIKNKVSGATSMLTAGITVAKGADPIDIFLMFSQEVVKVYEDTEKKNQQAVALAAETGDSESDIRDMVIAAPMPSDMLPSYPKDPGDWGQRDD